MGGIKYYQLAKGEELPDEFCAVRDVGGEPSEYTFYVPEAENVKLRELLQMALTSHNKMCTNRGTCLECLFFNAKPFEPACPIISVTRDARELGIEVDDGAK